MNKDIDWYIDMQINKTFSPFLLLIFVLEKLFEFLRVLHIGAAVRLWVKHTQPSPPPYLNTHFTTKHSINMVQLQKGSNGRRTKSNPKHSFCLAFYLRVFRKHKLISLICD